LVLALLLAAIFLCQPAHARETAPFARQQVVHVGFFHFEGYHDMDTAGEKSGYGYDFLQMIAGYANFKYIYVGYQRSWDDMLEMLDSGEIDMLTYAVKLPEYEKRFDFSEHSIGTSSAILTTSTSNAAFAANDYRPFDGMRVGFLPNANRKAAFDDYAKKKGFSYTPVYYADITSMQAALAAGSEIDAMVSDELRVLSDEVIIDKFDRQDIYVMVKKGNTDLLHTIDEAIRKLNMADPGWNLDLQKKYFLSDYSASFSMTPTEVQYVESLSSSGKKLRVLFNPARYPFSYYQDGEAAGVLVDIFKNIAADYGLPYEFVKTDNVDAYTKLREDDEADIVLDFAESTDEAEVLGYRLTSSYADANCSVITSNNFTGTPRTAAVISGSDTFGDIAKESNARMKISNYATFEDCVAAVKSGAVDCTYTYSITAQIYVIKDKTNSIKATQLNSRNFQFRLAVNSDADMALYGLLNKATHSQDSSDTNELLNAYVLDAKRGYSLWNYFTDHPAVLIAALSVVMLTLVGFILFQRKNSRQLKTSNDALEASRGALENALAEANSANASKTRFLSQMSHDIRTPLNGIIGMTNIAAGNAEDPQRVSDALDKIRHSSDHLLTLINDILDLSRIESGKMTIAHDPIDIRATIDQCTEVLKGSAINRDLTINTDTERIEYPFVLTDALHIRQILINIISNAVKFTPDGGSITFRAEGRKNEADNTLLCRFEISDTGIGMSEEFQKHIFEAFVQEDTYNARTQFKGSGLGMSIVKQLVDLLNGRIGITSELHVGTSIVVELPFEMDRNAVEKPDENPDEGRGYRFEGVHVLLAEDNEINMEIAKTLLESSGIRVDTAEDGKMAVEAFAASEVGEYRCILMDVMMPNMNGYEATRTIRSMERQDAKTIPIIAMTANAFAEDVQAALDNGMNAHIAKPINMRIVMETLAKYINVS
jgi:signal transduction histidine kinase/ActR/RegA family two-component response regulator